MVMILLRSRGHVSIFIFFIAACDTDACTDECSEGYVHHLEGRRIATDTQKGKRCIFGSLDS